jgi:hypothetical protein
MHDSMKETRYAITEIMSDYQVFGLIRTGLEPTIYRSRGKHVNHYTTDAVQIKEYEG